ncbi:hypothetical protein JCM12681A_64020 [Streptomyces mexicanus]
MIFQGPVRTRQGRARRFVPASAVPAGPAREAGAREAFCRWRICRGQRNRLHRPPGGEGGVDGNHADDEETR